MSATNDVPHGRVERYGRHIKLYDFDDGGLTAGLRAIQIYLPDSYEESVDHYPVVYFSDGGNAFSGPGARMDVDLAYNQLIADDLINPAIFVGIGIAGLAGRFADLRPTGESGIGGLNGYYRFISERLKPYIDRTYRTKPEPASTGIAGYSLGGSSAFWMAYMHPATFGMAGCMSWDHEYARKPVKDDISAGKKPIRFWLDGGGGEYETWLNAACVYGLLEQKGWIPGDELAAYFDYHADHRFEAGAGRMREMLHFLLRKEPLRLERFQLVWAVDPTAPMMDLSSGLRSIVGTEAWYAKGLRLTVPQPDLTVADTGIVRVDAHDPFLLHGVGPGETTISATYRGSNASLPVHGIASEAWYELRPYFVCPPIDGSPNFPMQDLLDLPHAILTTDQTAVAHFGVWHDRDHIHIAVRVQDSSVVAELDTKPGDRNTVVVWFDARPEEDLGTGGGTYEDFLHFCLSPGKPGEQIRLYDPTSDNWVSELPAGTEAACKIVPGGYQATLSIPTSYLDAKQDGSWKVFRLNLRIDDIETHGSPSAWWQPYWHTFNSPIRTGIFRKG